MKANYLITISLFLLAGLLSSCNKDDNNDPDSTGTYEDLEAVFEKIGENQKLYMDLAPVELPEHFSEPGDTMMQKIVFLAELINNSREKAIFPEFVDSEGSKKSASGTTEQLLQSKGISSDGEWEMECFYEGTPNWNCKFTKWDNNGKLEIVLTQRDSPEAWLIDVRLNGEAANGEIYDDLVVQSWIMAKDLTISIYRYSVNFYPQPPCTPDILWEFIREVEGQDAWLHFMGESKSLATYIHTTITHSCEQMHGYHIRMIRQLMIEPDETVTFTTCLYSYKLQRTYTWIVYVVHQDRSWSLTVYDEYGMVIKHEEGP